MFPASVDQALSLPPDDAVKSLLALPENQWFDRKTGRISPQDLAVPLVALANAEGGVVVVGLHDGRVVPVTDAADNALRQAAVDYTVPSVRARVSQLDTSEGRVLVFNVEPGDVVHETNKRECYQRIGDESRRLDFAQRQEFEWDRGAASFDMTPVAGVIVSDLDDEQLGAYQKFLGSSTPELALAARDLLTRDGAVTVAGYLLFTSRPQSLFPSAHVRVLRYHSNERGAGSRQVLVDGGDIRCEGSIPEQITRAAAVIEELLPRRRALAESGRFEGATVIPREAWLEGLVNAVVHRSYSSSGDHIRIEIFPNRMEITSPGRFPGLVDPVDPETISRNARNPRIARVCADLGVTQELGEGIRRIFAEMRRVGLSEPIYKQSAEAVRLTLFASDAVPDDLRRVLGDGAMRVLDGLRLAQRPLGTGQVVELVGMTRPTVLRHLAALEKAGLIAWEGQSSRDPRATWRLL